MLRRKSGACHTYHAGVWLQSTAAPLAFRASDISYILLWPKHRYNLQPVIEEPSFTTSIYGKFFYTKKKYCVHDCQWKFVPRKFSTFGLEGFHVCCHAGVISISSLERNASMPPSWTFPTVVAQTSYNHLLRAKFYHNIVYGKFFIYQIKGTACIPANANFCHASLAPLVWKALAGTCCHAGVTSTSSLERNATQLDTEFFTTPRFVYATEFMA